MVPLGFLAFIVICLAVDGFVQIARKRRAAVMDSVAEKVGVLDEGSIIVPKGIYFDKSHTWAFMGKFGDVKIGIDDFLQNVVGNITKIEMKETGTFLKKGDTAFTIVQNGKRLNVNSPVTGKIISQNQIFTNDVSSINSSPYNEGWVYKIEPDDWQNDTRFMMMAEKAKEWIGKEFIRLKDFLTMKLSTKSMDLAYIPMQDGGQLKSNILEDLGPAVWEDFQTNFLNKN